MTKEENFVIHAKETTLWELLVNYRAHEVFNSREGQVLSFNGDSLSSETDLQKEGDPMHRAPGVGEALGTETAIGETTGEPRLGT